MTKGTLNTELTFQNSFCLYRFMPVFTVLMLKTNHYNGKDIIWHKINILQDMCTFLGYRDWPRCFLHVLMTRII